MTSARAQILGDINHDGLVDCDDVAPFIDALLCVATSADLNGDGVVDCADWLVFQAELTQHAGGTLPPCADMACPQPPEPITFTFEGTMRFNDADFTAGDPFIGTFTFDATIPSIPHPDSTLNVQYLAVTAYQLSFPTRGYRFEGALGNISVGNDTAFGDRYTVTLFLPSSVGTPLPSGRTVSFLQFDMQDRIAAGADLLVDDTIQTTPPDPDAAEFSSGRFRFENNDQPSLWLTRLERVLFVDADAVGANDGSSWTDALTDLQSALSLAAGGRRAVQQIWVAEGTYTPTSGTGEAFGFQGLGDLPGNIFLSLPNDISADGVIVVGLGISASGGEAFRWTSGGGMVGLGDLPLGAFNSVARAVSADGAVVVGRGFSASGAEAFRWTSGGGMVGLGDLPGGDFASFAQATSADGSVVVGCGTPASGNDEAFRWTSGAGMVGLGDLPSGGFGSQAFGVSADGAVVVGQGISASGAEAFRWTSGGGMVGLGDLPGGVFQSIALDVSADGSIVVGRSDSASGQEAFRWTLGGGMVGLGDLPGGSFNSGALATSPDGSVVVGVGNSASGVEAFLWTADGGMRSLQDLLATDFGLDLTGWHLQQARGISADGLTIVGSGTNPDGFAEAWIATLGTSSDRAATFQLINGVAIYGGFAGGETDLSQRDPQTNLTILSGDLNGNDAQVNDPADLLDEPTRAENSFHVASGGGTDATAVLDGFRITAGRAAPFPEAAGGGLDNWPGGSPTIRHCTFISNAAALFGGAIRNQSSSTPAISHCLFLNNAAVIGGAIFNGVASNATISDSAFIGNVALDNGGAVNNSQSAPIVANCSFLGNTAISGGAMVNQNGSDALVFNCVFSGNAATGLGGARGGAIFNDESQPVLINCTLTQNTATASGGGVFNINESSPALTNCIVWLNQDISGAGQSAQIHNDDSLGVNTPTVNHSLITGGWSGAGGNGIIDADPQFADADGADNVAGTLDDDLRVSAASPVIDGGDNAALPADASDLDGDTDTAEPIPFDLDGNPRIVNGTVDMGAFEAQIVDTDEDGFTDDVEIMAGSDPFDPASTPEVCDGVDNDLNDGVDEGFLNTDGDDDADCVDLDDDGDGILDEVDVQPFVISTAFSDVPLGGVTSGEVVGGLVDGAIPEGVLIADAANPNRGIQVEVPGTDVLVFDFDCASYSVKTQGPSVTLYTCGSLSINAISGSATATFAIDGVEHEVVVEGGGSVTLEETLDEFGELAAVTVTSAGTEGTVTVDGQVAIPGEITDVLSVEIDIKPGSFPNSINLGSQGTVPVAIYSTATFDATTIDPLGVSLAGAAVRLRGRGTPQVSFEDVNGDGLLDLVIHVETEALELSETDTEAALTASADGDGDGISDTIIRGLDTIRVVP